MKGKWFCKKSCWLLVILLLILTTTSVFAATSPYIIDSFWMADPLFTGEPGDPTGAEPGDTVAGYYYRDTTNQNALAQFTADQFTDEVVSLYTSDTLNVYEYIGDISTNVTLITTPSNYFVVGCGGSTDGATRAKSRTSGLTVNKTFRGLILTSTNFEDIWGCKVWTKSQQYVVLYTNAYFAESMSYSLFINAFKTEQRPKLAGSDLSWGSDGLLGSGIMEIYDTSESQYYQSPSVEISEQTDVTLDDATITLIPTLREDNGMAVYLPDPGILILGESYGPYLPYFGLSGQASHRVSPTMVVLQMDKFRTLSPNILVYKSGQPVIGNTEATDTIIAQRDALQYLRDETLSKINQGMAEDEIVATTHLTEDLSENTYNQEYVIDEASIVHWIYTYSVGWFGGEPIELADTLTDVTKAQMLADAYGGTDALIEAARQAELAAGDQESAEKALYLAYSAYKLSPDDFQLKRTYNQILKKLAFMQKSAFERNYYLESALGLGDEPAVSDLVKTGQEDTPLAFSAAEFNLQFTNISSSPLSMVTITTLPDEASGTLSLPGVDENGNAITVPVTAAQEIAAASLDSLVFTPALNWNGDTSFQWTGKGIGDYTADPASVLMTIAPVNDAPTLTETSPTDMTVEEDSASSTIDFSAAFFDVDIDTNSDTLAYSAASSNADAVAPAVSGSTLTLSYLPDWNGTATVTITATDTGGLTASDTFTVTVSPVNDAPTAADTVIEVIAGQSQTITLDYSDVETPQENLQVTFGTLNGTLTTSALPSLTYTAPSTAGDDSFTVSITDRGDPDNCIEAPCSAALSTTATIQVTVLQAPSGSISGTVFDDANGNGTQDSDESGLEGVSITLSDTSETLLNSTTSAADGSYSFTGLDAGSFIVASILDSNRVQTTENPVEITLDTNESTVTAVDFGSVVSADLSVSMTASYNSRTKTITYTIIVTNDGPESAVSATMTDVLPGTVVFKSITKSVGTCSGTKTVTCDFGTLASEASATVKIEVARISYYPVVNTVSVTSDTYDIDAEDNSVTVTTR